MTAMLSGRWQSRLETLGTNRYDVWSRSKDETPSKTATSLTRTDIGMVTKMTFGQGAGTTRAVGRRPVVEEYYVRRLASAERPTAPAV